MSSYQMLMPYFVQLEKENAFEEYSPEHIIMKALKNDDLAIKKLCQFDGKNSLYSPNANSFLINIVNRLDIMQKVFKHEKIIAFVKNQMSAGKARYEESLFIQSFSEIELLAYLCHGYFSHISNAIYEPPKDETIGTHLLDAKRNPEAYIQYENGVSIYIEIKTPKFQELILPANCNGVIQPNVLFDISHQKDYNELLFRNKYQHRNNSLAKIKSFIYSAIHKFNFINQKKTYNILALNFSMSPWRPYVLDEPESLFLNSATGLLRKNDLVQQYLFSPNKNGEFFTKEELSKISAFLIYFTTPMQFLFSDWRCSKGNCILLSNPYAFHQDISPLEDIFNTKCSSINSLQSNFSLFYYALPSQEKLSSVFKEQMEKILGKNIGITFLSL